MSGRLSPVRNWFLEHVVDNSGESPALQMAVSSQLVSFERPIIR